MPLAEVATLLAAGSAVVGMVWTAKAAFDCLIEVEEIATAVPATLIVPRLPNYYVDQAIGGRWLVIQCGTHKVVYSTSDRHLAEALVPVFDEQDA